MICANARDIPLRGAICADARRNLYHIASAQQIKAGDTIIFTNTATGEMITKRVQKLHRFESFAQLYKALPLLQCGYTQKDIDTAHPMDMEQYYSIEEQEQYGVVGIALCD